MKEKIQHSLQRGEAFQVKLYSGDQYEVKDLNKVTPWESCLVLFGDNGMPHLLPYESISEVIAA